MNLEAAFWQSVNATFMGILAAQSTKEKQETKGKVCFSIFLDERTSGNRKSVSKRNSL